MFKALKENINTVFERDPAARSVLEIIFCYPGIHALWFHRCANFLWRNRLLFPARLLSHISRFFTGVDIHPGAKIGRRFFVDHGAGVVIGETVEIGDDVLMYQGAILGGTTLKKEKRHPTVGNNVVIGANSVVLGPIAIGDNVKIGSGSVVLKSIPSGSTVVGVPGRIVEEQQEHLLDLEHGKLPDPVADALRFVLKEQEELKARLRKLEKLSKLDISKEEVEELESQITSAFTQGEGI